MIHADDPEAVGSTRVDMTYVVFHNFRPARSV